MTALTIKKTRFDTINKFYGEFELRLTQQVWVHNDGRKQFGPTRAVILMDGEHCIDSWITNTGRKMNPPQLDIQHKLFMDKHKATISRIKQYKRAESIIAAEKHALDEALKNS